MRSSPFFIAAGLLAVSSLVVTTGELEPYALIPQLLALLSVCAGMVARDTRTGAFVTAVVTAGLSSYLFSEKASATAGSSLCDINAVFNCGIVNDSVYSELAGIPITLFGLAFYAGLALAALTAPKDDASFDKLNTLTGAFSVLYSLFLAWASTQIGAFCLFCISMYIGNIILLWSGIKGMRERDAGLDGLGAVANSRAVTVLIGTFVVMSFVGNRWYVKQTALPPVSSSGTVTGSGTAANDPAVFAQLYSRAGGPVELTGTEPVIGSPDARYVIVEWADFGCPHCARAGKELKDLVAANPDVQVRFKYFPLSGPCNPDIPEQGVERCYAAYAAECAGNQGKFWEMSNQLFTNQGFFEPEQLAFMAREIGLDEARWEQCLEDPKTLETVQAAARAGTKAGVQGTPYILLKGITADGFVEVPRGAPAIDTLLEAHRTGVPLPSPGR